MYDNTKRSFRNSTDILTRRKRIILHELFVSDKTLTYSCLSFNYLDTLSITSSKYVQTEIHIKFYETSFKLVLCNLSLLSLIRSISCYSNMHLFIENDGTLIPYNVLREHCPLNMYFDCNLSPIT